MKPNVLRGPLVKSAVVLIILSLLVYFTSTTPGGSVWSSIGTLFIAAVKTVQWAVALAIGLSVSLAVMIGIFLGAAALFNPASSSRMYEGLRLTLADWFAPVIALFQSDREEKLAAALESQALSLKKEFSTDLQAVQAGVQKKQAELESKIGGIASRLAALAATTEALAPAEQVDAVAEEVKGVAESAAQVQSAVDASKDSVAQTSKQVEEISAEAILGDLPSRLETLEQQEIPEPPKVDIEPLHKEIAALKTELAAVQEKSAEAVKKAVAAQEAASVAQPVKEEKPAQAEKAARPVPKQKATKDAAKEKKQAPRDEEHRIFSYFSDAADKKKVAELVASTLKKDMSYKQVMDLLAKGLGGKKGAIITSHPSLSKDYIRQCRRNNS
jgi:predicted  nucleic acid-binding Zn-ribbon protein